MSIFLIVLISSSIKSQDIQTPFCEGIQNISSQQAGKVSIFKNIPEFKEANLYTGPDGNYFIEIYYYKKGQLLRERKAISREEIDQICSELTSQKPTEVDDQRDFGRDGKRRLLASSMAYGLGYYGWAVPLAFNADEGKAYATSYMFIGSASFFIPFLATRNKEVTMGMAKGYQAGSLLGIAHGWTLGIFLQGDDLDPRFGLGLSVATSFSEGLIQYSLARKNNLSYSRIATIESGGSWGALQGLALPYLFDSENPRVYAFSSLSLSGLGMFGGNYISKKQNITTGDIAVINTLGVIGTYVPVSILNTINDDFNKSKIATMMVGSLAFLGYGLHKTKNIDYDNQQGNIVTLGTLAGYLTGLGFAYISESSDDGYTILSSLGTTLGFIVTDALILKDIKKNTNKKNATLNIDLNPYPLVGFLNVKSNDSRVNYRLQDYNYFVKVRLKF